MAKYHILSKAFDDLSDIWDYTFDVWSETQADKYYESLLQSCQQIATNPALGKRYPEIGNTLLGFKTGEHIIFYIESDSEEIDIVRILHAKMDLKKKFY